MVNGKPPGVGRQIVPWCQQTCGWWFNSNYFIGLRDILDRNAAFDIVQEVRLERGKASRSSKIVDKKGVIWGMRNTFKDLMKIG